MRRPEASVPFNDFPLLSSLVASDRLVYVVDLHSHADAEPSPDERAGREEAVRRHRNLIHLAFYRFFPTGWAPERSRYGERTYTTSLNEIAYPGVGVRKQVRPS